MSTTHHDQHSFTPSAEGSQPEGQQVLFGDPPQNAPAENLDPTTSSDLPHIQNGETESDVHLVDSASATETEPTEDPTETLVQPGRHFHLTRRQKGAIGVTLLAGVGLGVGFAESGSSSHSHPTTITQPSQPSPRSTATETTSSTVSPSPTSLPTSTATTTPSNGNEQGGSTTSENLASLPENVVSVAEKYGLQLKTVSYDVYPEGTRKYAQAKGLPDHYYDLTSLTQPLTMEDYKTLAPVLLTNLFLASDTNNVHYMDMGNGTQFGDNTTPTPPPYLFAPDSGKDQWGEATGFGTFSLTPDNVKVYEAPYDGPLTKYAGQDVIHVDFTNVHVREISSQGLNGGYIDTIGEQTGSYPDLGNSSADGPFLIQSLQFDPQTNNVIAHSFSNRY